MTKNTPTRIQQGVIKIVFQNKSHVWYRISRRNFSDLVYYWQHKSNFYYAKIYDIPNYKRGTHHIIGMQIGYITLKGSLLDPLGLMKTDKQTTYYIEKILNAK